MRSIFLHLHPAQVNVSALKLNRTFGLGGMAALLLIVQFFTGILLRFHYTPSLSGAYDSIIFLKNQVIFGQFIRNIHYWSGVLFLLISFLHFLRVYLTGAFRERRSVNWIIGLILLLLAVLSNFTGYLLPWDQLAYWAVTVVTNIIGYLPLAGETLRNAVVNGRELNADTLQNFFTFHTAVLPALLAAFALYHFWRVRKAGGVLLPASAANEAMVPVMPNLVFREFIAALVLLAILLTFAALFNAPLLDRANPAYSMNPTKAPWYFAGVQELLMHFHPFFAAFIIPGAVVAFLFWIPYIQYNNPPNGQWFISGTGRHSAMITAFFAVFVTLTGILFNEYLLNFETLLPGIPAVISNGVVPFFILLSWMAGYYLISLRKQQPSREELIQAIFVFLMAAFIVLTVIGIFFRGKDMELTWPWVVFFGR